MNRRLWLISSDNVVKFLCGNAVGMSKYLVNNMI